MCQLVLKLELPHFKKILFKKKYLKKWSMKALNFIMCLKNHNGQIFSMNIIVNIIFIFY